MELIVSYYSEEIKMIEETQYKSPSIEGHETAVKNRVVSFVESLGSDKLLKAKRYLHQAVDYVMSNLPNGVDRVDGNIIQPILNQVVDEKMSELVSDVEDEPTEIEGEE